MEYNPSTGNIRLKKTDKVILFLHSEKLKSAQIRKQLSNDIVKKGYVLFSITSQNRVI